MGLLVSGKNPAALKTAERSYFTATSGQTVFTVPGGYLPGDIDVFMNGVRLVEGDDYFAVNGSTITLSSGAGAGDSIAVVGYYQFQAAGSYTKSESDSRYLTASGSAPMTSFLRTPNYGISSTSDSFSSEITAAPVGQQGVGVKAYGRSMSTFGGDLHHIADTRGVGGSQRFYGWNGTSLTTYANIDSSGRLTLPYQPSFHAYPGSTVSVAAGNNKFIFNSTRYNIGNHYSTSTGRFTAPVSGVYLFTFQAYYYPGATSDSYYGLNLFVNGSNSYVGYGRGGYGDTTWGNSIHFRLNANDYVEIFTYPSASTNLNTSGSYLTGHLVG